MLIPTRLSCQTIGKRLPRLLNVATGRARLESTATAVTATADSNLSTMPDAVADGRQTVVILGSGWAGYNLLKTLDPRYYRCIVVSPRSYFVFTPLLASTSVGTLEFRVAMESVRDKGLGWHKLSDVVTLKRSGGNGIKQKNADGQSASSVELVQALATNIDLDNKVVTVSPRISEVGPQPFDIKYDKLAITVGSYSQTFNTKGVKENACFLKDVADAQRIRQRILERFEGASLPVVSEEKKRAMLHFCVVGGGPTGIEFSAELHDLINDDMKLYYPNLMPYVRITVFDVAKSILGTFDKSLGQYAEQYFRRQGIHIRTQVKVQEVTPDAMFVKNEDGKDETIQFGLLVWSTGLAPNPFVVDCNDILKDKRHTIVTDDHLNVYRPDAAGGRVLEPSVYALGDCAQIENGALPATAQVASQKALYLAKQLNIDAKKPERATRPAFKFNNRGIMAYLGGWRAIVQGNKGEVKGRTAWLLWRGAYLSMSCSIKNKILIAIYWFANWIFGRDITRF